MTRVMFDSSLKFYMVSPSAWTATGATQWFENYRIISSLDNPIADKLGVLSLGRYTDKVPKTTKEIINSPLLNRVLQDNGMQGYKMLLNRASANRSDALGNSFDVVSRYENKVWLRKQYASELEFPPFRIVKLGELRNHTLPQLKEEMNTQAVIIQHASLAGGRGTYRITTSDEYQACIESLGSLVKDSDEVVVSAFVDAYERTLQACVTEEEVLVGPPQAQLVSHPLLTSPRPGDIQFCGGRIAPGLLDDAHYQDAVRQVQAVGSQLQSEGYRGIFGMDFLVSKDKTYALEVNPRMTGLTTLLAFLQQDVPFLLLHILELAKSNYTIESTLPRTGSGSFIQVYAQEAGVVSFETGRYNRGGEKVGEGFERGNILPESDDDCFVAMRVAKNTTAAQGKSLAFIYSRRQLFTDDGTLDSAAALLVNKIRT